MLIRIGHSPDPDDAFMFHAMTNGLIDTANRVYEHRLLDIETLNQKSAQGEFRSIRRKHSFISKNFS